MEYHAGTVVRIPSYQDSTSRACRSMTSTCSFPTDMALVRVYSVLLAFYTATNAKNDSGGLPPKYPSNCPTAKGGQV